MAADVVVVDVVALVVVAAVVVVVALVDAVGSPAVRLLHPVSVDLASLEAGCGWVCTPDETGIFGFPGSKPPVPPHISPLPRYIFETVLFDPAETVEIHWMDSC